MKLLRRTPFGLSLMCLLAAGIAALAAAPDAAPVPELNRDQQIATLQKQIADLQKKLAELQKPAAAPSNEPKGTLPADWVKQFTWRPIGPASMGGRVAAITAYEADPTTFWIATASGGLLKTTNNGTTFEHQFDREAVVSIGDVCVAQSNKDVVWVGTGENNPRNSVSYGDGVYKSTDGGKTWKNMGLKKSFQIGRIAINPHNPDVVYVGVLGRLYGPSEERGLFKTSDGGNTWQKVLFLDDRTGIIDVAMNPAEPDTLLVAAWERRRDGFDSHRGEPAVADGYDAYDPIQKWGKAGGIYKTIDGGKTFRKLSNGLPTASTGRIGLDWYRKDPKEAFAIIDCEKIGMGPVPAYLGIAGQDKAGGVTIESVTDNSPAHKAGLKAGDVIKTVDKQEVKNFQALGEILDGHRPGETIHLDLLRDKETKDVPVTLGTRAEDAPKPFIGVTGENAQGKGARLTLVTTDSPAAKAGLLVGDIILSLDKKEMKDFAAFVEAVRTHKAGDKLALQVQRENQTKEIVLTVETRANTMAEGRPYSYAYGGQRPNEQRAQGPEGNQYGGIYKTVDGGESWTRINSLNPRPMYFSLVRVDPTDDKYLYVGGIEMYHSEDGGKTFKALSGPAGEVHPDQHALWLDTRDGRHMVVGCDGGFYATFDRMQHWDHLNNVDIGQFYHVAIDSQMPYKVYGGLQDNGSWGGPSRSMDGQGPINEDWFMVGGGDGFVCRVDPTDPDLVYWESQDGNIVRRNLRTGQITGLRPQPQQGLKPYRFNWNTPFILSDHNPKIVYSAGNYVFRSLKEGEGLKPISPEIARTGRGTGTALAESPRNADVLYVGTDDGNLWVTKDGGVKWTNVADKVGLPSPRWVASIEASRYVDGRAYVVFDAHRSDDDEPYVYVTEDYGQTWKPLRGNLPTGSTRVLREDIKNQNLLYLGTEFAAWASTNRGTTWTKINNNLPTVAVHEFAQHATCGEMVAATHGRSLWVVDVTPLRQLTTEVLTGDKPHLLEPNTVIRWHREPLRGTIYGSGSRKFVGTNPPTGAHIYYTLPKKAEKVTLKVINWEGKTVRELPTSTVPGFHHAPWDLAPLGAQRGPRGAGGGIANGIYRVVLTVDGQESSQPLQLQADPTRPTALSAEVQERLEREFDPEQREREGDRDGDRDAVDR